MPLQKQAVTVNFMQGLDLKTDPNQIAVGRFVSLQNSIFDKLGRLTKRNGFGAITALPDGSSSFLTTFNGSLTAIGNNLRALGPTAWVNKGDLQPVQISTLPLIRNSTNQSYVDTAFAGNGLVCTVFTDNVTAVVNSTTQAVQKYVIADSATGQNIIPPTQIISTFGTVTQSAKVFTLGNNFIVTFGVVGSGNVAHIQYFPINAITPTSVGSTSDFTSNFTISSTSAFDGVVAGTNLYLSWNSSNNGGVKAAYLTSLFSLSSTVTLSSQTATHVSVAVDNTTSVPNIYTSFYVNGSNSGYVVATDAGLSSLFSSQQFFSSTSGQIASLASSARNGLLTTYFEQVNSYTYDPTIPSDFINLATTTATGVVNSASVSVIRSVGLASKAFLIGSTSYFLSAYQSPYQPTYFLMNSSGGTIAKLAYGNGGGYLTAGLPSVTVAGSTAKVGYLFKDLVQAVNKDTNVAAGTQTAGIYSQLGVNLASFTFGTSGLSVTEIGSNLNLNGGYLWGYDGFQAVENNFHVFPDSVNCSQSSTIGSMTSQQYYYQATYEWSDNQGNLFRSAPSIPVSASISSGNSSMMLVRVPTLRITGKVQNPVKIVLYRWSTAQQSYYQTTSIFQPIQNSLASDFITYSDRNSDAQILGNNLIYTNGGVVENIGAPSFDAVTVFDSRFWGISAEDKNLLWYGKQVIEATPVEMSDLFTLFVSPNAGAQGPTGPMKCIAPMDDKLIIFKKNAIYYINGTGPDNTGANAQYSQPTFITGTVGCSNQNSIVLIPSGLMFQSDKGIWLLGRDLSTQYIGKDVESYNQDLVKSAVAVPGTNQVRFTLTSGVTLLYDYFSQQWGTFTGIPGVSSCLYQNLHTFINSAGLAYQETPGVYLDGSNAVLMQFTTGFISLAGLQGYKRIYEMFMLGEFKTPHRLTVGVAQDYDSNVQQLASIVPTNYSGVWGSGTSWGSISFWGGTSAREQWQINFQNQQCQSFQISFNEYYDGQYGVAAGAGLTVSGFTVIAGIKGQTPQNIGAKNRTG